MTRLTLAAVLCCGLLSATPARGDLTFTDFTGLNPGTDTASGTIGPVSVVVTGPAVDFAVLNGTFTGFNEAFFTPPLPSSDMVEVQGSAAGSLYTIGFGAPLVNPRLHLFSVASVMNFPGITLTKLSGETTFVVAGSTVTGVVSGSTDASGTVQLNGTFSVVNFTATFPGVDGISMQIGADVVPEPGGLAAFGIGAVIIGCRPRRTRRARDNRRDVAVEVPPPCP